MKITAAGSGSRASSKGVVLLTSGMHAREYAPPELLMRFAESLVKNYKVDADTTWILQHTDIHIVFYVNPDGRRKAEKQPETSWRKNVNPGSNNCSANKIGVDINRNFDFLWGNTDGASTSPCASDYMGKYKQSEPETIALSEYAKSIFPEGQRKYDPKGQMNEAFGEDIMGLYMDIHAYGGYTYYPWGHKDAKSPDNDSLEALGRKISSFNGYDLWAGGQPDFLYAVSGDSSEFMYAVLGVASFGLEIGQKFYESCATFENDILPSNLPALLYATKVSSRPNSLAKGPDIIDLDANVDGRTLTVTASASDSQLVNIPGYPDFSTGDQTVVSISFSLGVHPDESEHEMVKMTKTASGFEGTLSLDGVSSGKHIVFAQAKDSDGYLGPISSTFITVRGSSPSSPTPSPTDDGASHWSEIAREDFTSDFGVFEKRGRSVRLLSKAKQRQGVVRIKHGSLRTSINGSYSKSRVRFSAFFLAEADEICLEKRNDDAWDKVKCWTGSDLGERAWYDDLGTDIVVDGETELPIRLRCPGIKTRVLVDKVSILAKS